MPCYAGNLKTTTLVGMLKLYRYCFSNKIPIEFYFITNDALISRARNTIVARFMDDANFNGTHLLFIDSDIGFNENNIERLIKKDQDVVCGCYPQKKINWNDVVKEVDHNPEVRINPNLLQSRALTYNLNIDNSKKVIIEDGFCEVDEAATGMLLIKKEVFLRLKEKYPERKYSKKSSEIHLGYSSDNLYDFFSVGFYDHKDGESRYLSEDYFFSRLWRDIDGKIFADLTAPLTHSGNMDFSGSAINKFK